MKDKVAFMTMDVESYFDTSCLKNKKIDRDPKYNCAPEILKYADFLTSHGIKGTFFLTASFIKDAKPYLLEAIKQGHEIALHCLNHQSYKKFSKEEFRQMILESKKMIKEELGVEPVGYRFPKFEYKEELFDVLKEEGFIYDSSVIKPNKKFIRIKDFVFFRNNLYEFSPNHLTLPFKTILLSGGGFYRFLKSKSILYAVKKHIREHNSFMIYFHPFEIHKGYLPVPWNILMAQKRYIRRNRETYLDFLDRLVNYLKDNGYEFYSMKEFVASIK